MLISQCVTRALGCLSRFGLCHVGHVPTSRLYVPARCNGTSPSWYAALHGVLTLPCRRTWTRFMMAVLSLEARLPAAVPVFVSAIEVFKPVAIARCGSQLSASVLCSLVMRASSVRPDSCCCSVTCAHQLRLVDRARRSASTVQFRAGYWDGSGRIPTQVEACEAVVERRVVLGVRATRLPHADHLAAQGGRCVAPGR